MAIRHAKVSGLTNPADPDLVGGEDWDDPHVITGPALVGVALLRLTSGGAILSQNSAGFASTFSKTGTGTYRADYDPADYGGVAPMVLAGVSQDLVEAWSPVFVIWTLENDGTDYIQLVTVKTSGTAINCTNAWLTLHAAAVL